MLEHVANLHDTLVRWTNMTSDKWAVAVAATVAAATLLVVAQPYKQDEAATFHVQTLGVSTTRSIRGVPTPVVPGYRPARSWSSEPSMSGYEGTAMAGRTTEITPLNVVNSQQVNAVATRIQILPPSAVLPHNFDGCLSLYFRRAQGLQAYPTRLPGGNCLQSC